MTTTDPNAQFFHDLKSQTAAVRLRIGKLGVRKALGDAQRDKAADAFNANGQFVSASKKLLDTRAPAYKAVTTAISRAKQHWRLSTVPYPEKGIRLMKRDKISQFEQAMHDCRSELVEALKVLSEELSGLITSAKANLGDLFVEGDYPRPEDLASLFRLEWEYPSLAVPEYLKQLNPQLYEAEMERLESRLQEAVAQNEQEMVGELNNLVENLLDKLTTGEDGNAKTLKASAVEGFGDFFQRFRDVNVTGNEQMEALVKQAEQAISGVDPKSLRKNLNLRDEIRSKLGAVKESLGAFIVDRPNRMYEFEDETHPEEVGAA